MDNWGWNGAYSVRQMMDPSVSGQDSYYNSGTHYFQQSRQYETFGSNVMPPPGFAGQGSINQSNEGFYDCHNDYTQYGQYQGNYLPTMVYSSSSVPNSNSQWYDGNFMNNYSSDGRGFTRAQTSGTETREIGAPWMDFMPSTSNLINKPASDAERNTRHKGRNDRIKFNPKQFQKNQKLLQQQKVNNVGLNQNSKPRDNWEAKPYNRKKQNTEAEYFSHDDAKVILDNIEESSQLENKGRQNQKKTNWRNNGKKQWRNKRADNAVCQRERLIEQLVSGTLECLVCCERVRHQDSVWSCSNCYHIFHLYCTVKWASSSKDDNGWRCPACQNITKSIPSEYTCMCGKVQSPEFIRGETPHCCGQICGRKKDCPHGCTILCHPGPCPQCCANIKRSCGCGRTNRTVLCSSTITIECESVCEKTLNCGVHACNQICHQGNCSPCDKKIDQECYCGQNKRTLDCDGSLIPPEIGGPTQYECGSRCMRRLSCGSHDCPLLCHPGPCPKCDLDPEVLRRCPCGGMEIPEGSRTKCTDPVPLCGKTCNKILQCGPEEADKKVKVNAITFSASSDKREDSPEKRVERLKQELIEVQLKYQKEIEKLEKDNKELKKQILLNKSSKVSRKQIKKSLIDMYSEVLDELSDYDANYSAQDHLPRVVVVGDQSSGKTSVLEMIAKARIFPRGAGEMMTRAPVKVTLSEGPYHIAQFKDSDREFDLTKEDDLAKLRTEVELRMKRSLSKGKSVSQEVIAMTVKGPGIQRMVLVDLPGIISTVTKDMAKDTRESIREMIKNHMSNPNSIVLCIQDGSVDAERSNITDLVAQIDPAGKRTIFVLTKVDMAEENLANPLRIQKILSGRLFPMKALGYFAVVTGRGRQDDSIAQIQEYEEQFFRNSKLFRSSSLSSHQLTTRNLSFAVSECFWKMVRETVEQQADLFKAERFNLETEWKNTFPSLRELDRDELFDKARGDILDEVVNLSQVSAKEWDILLAEKMWDKVAAYVVDNIYLPAAQAQNPKAFNTVVDIRLKEWAERKLAELSIEAGQDALRHEFVQLMESSMKSKSSDHLFDALKRAALEEALKRHKWEDKGNEMLRMIQLNTLEDRCVNDKQQWDSAILLLEKCLKDKLAENESVQKETFGPGTTERWLHWKSTTEAQRKRSSAKNEIEKILYSDPDHGPDMTEDELTTIKKNLERLGVRDPTKEMILEAWPSIYLRHFLHKMMRKVYSCRKGFYLYHHNKEELECQDVVLFWRMEQMLKVTANALRQQVMNREARRLDKIIKEVLEDFSEDRDLKVKLLTGRRVTLAEELKRVRQIQEKLEEFIQALNKEK